MALFPYVTNSCCLVARGNFGPGTARAVAAPAVPGNPGPRCAPTRERASRRPAPGSTAASPALRPGRGGGAGAAGPGDSWQGAPRRCASPGRGPPAPARPAGPWPHGCPRRPRAAPRGRRARVSRATTAGWRVQPQGARRGALARGVAQPPRGGPPTRRRRRYAGPPGAARRPRPPTRGRSGPLGRAPRGAPAARRGTRGVATAAGGGRRGQTKHRRGAAAAPPHGHPGCGAPAQPRGAAPHKRVLKHMNQAS